MVDIPTLIVISAIMLLVGAAIGYVLSMLRFGANASQPGRKPSHHTDRRQKPEPARSPSPNKDSKPVVETSLSAVPRVDMNNGVSAEQDKAARVNPLDVFARALSSEAPKTQPIQSLAAQIDAILQERLEGSPLSTRGIRLHEHPQQGLVVQVGLNRYNSVDEVPEKEIRDFIRAAIKAWEKNVGGG